MPMVRYEIRNEHSLADPELYRAADKDDPEALLEGVAMAGLVGVLRQLGDLAEFAAEIFHNLHEEVMATAARGHGLMIRVQQLETEVPSIERAFLSQTDHSSFFYHPGVYWHPNLQVDQNLVTQRDLPRFIMDSYEECRAPPRLFLLDKFDVAGAGACLKRYTDPSFFKVETFGMATADVQREKKIRKAKKKGPRWRNGETPEVQPTSHAKLHQLFLEERVENGVGNPSRRAQLKRRLNGFPFDSKPGKSYMEKLLKSPSPDHKVLHEVTLNSSPLMLATNDHNKSGLEILEVRPVSPDRESEARKRSPPSSPERDESMLNPSIYEISEVPVDDKISELPNSYPSVGTDSISSTKVTGEKVIAVDAESNGHGMLTGEHSDGIASEVDNYVDAPSTMESEMDADSEFRVKSDFTSSHNKNQPLVSDANEEHFRTSSSESQSTGDSTISDEGNNSSRKETYCSSSSDSPGTSAENPQSEEISAKGFLSAGITEIEIVDASSCEKNAGEDFPVDQHSKPVVPDDTCPGTDAITNKKSDSEQQAYCLCSNQSIYTALSSDSIVVGKGISKGPESDEIASPLDDREQKKNLAIDPPCSPTVSDFESHSGDDSPRSPAGELVDEPNGEIVPDISTVPGIHSYTTDSSVAISSDLRHEDESDQEHQNLGEDIASSLNKSNALSVNTNGTPDMISSDLIQGKPDDEFPKLTEGFPSDYPDTAHNGHNIKSAVHDGEYLIDELDNENLNVSSNAPNCIPSNTEDFLGRKLEETSPVDAQTVDAEDTRSNSSIENHISSENAILSHLANFLDWPQAGSDAHEGDVIPEVTTVNETLPLGTSRTCEVVNLQGTGIIGGISPNDSEALGRSLPTPEDLEEPQGTSDTVEKDGITPCTNSTGQEVPERSDSANPESVNEVHVLLDESQSEADKSHTADMASAVPAVPENAIVDNVLDKLAEENIHCFEDSGLDELENDKNDISGSHRQASLVEQVSQTTDATSDLKRVFCNTTYDDYPKSEVSETAPNSHLDFEVDCRLEFVHAAAIQPLMEQSGHDTDEEVFQQSGHVSDAQDLPVAYEAEESIVQEKIGLPPSQLDQEIPLSGEISSELSPSLPTNHQQMPDRDDCKGDNNSASTFSLVNCQGPPSVSDISRLSNYGLNVPGYPKDPLGSILPPSNPFSGTADQINMDDLPPLPPLPPVQWRMGKLQHASSSAEGEMTKHEELFPQLISLPTASTNDVSSSPPSASADAVPSSPTTSTNEASLLLEEAKPSPVQIARETPSEEKVENSCSSLTASIIPETASKEEKAENICYSSESGILPENISKEEKVENSCSSLTASIIPETASKEEKAENICYSLESGILPETISKEEKVENSCSSLESGIIPVTISKEEKVENSSSTREANETVDLPPKIENEQQRQQFVMPTSESEFTSPAEEDGVTNGNRTVKLPRPRNPLVDDVAALDKSKLRKVTERVRPQIQKVDERDSLLEQIRTKSFNLKPAMASRPSIRGPNTNLRVAAILEKANAIRQAFAGSDEDDDDCWSDS